MYPDMPAQSGGGNHSDEEKGKNKKDLEAGNKRGKSSGNAYDDLDSIMVRQLIWHIVAQNIIYL